MDALRNSKYKKSIFLIRHAKSSWKHAAQINDINRPLNFRGVNSAKKMAKRLPAISFDQLLTSDAQRALQTASIFTREINLDFSDLVIMPQLYHASAATILATLNEMDSQAKCIALFAHNPGINDFVFETGIDIPNVVTTGILHYQYEGDWADLTFSQLEFIGYDFPKKK